MEPAPEPGDNTDEETIPEPVMDDAIDAALAALATDDAGAADSGATQVVIAGVDAAGRTEPADTIRTQEAIVEQARIRTIAQRGTW